MRRRGVILGIGIFLPLALLLGGRLWTLRAAPQPGVGSPFLFDPAHFLSRSELARRGLSAGPWGDAWRDLSPDPLAPGYLPWDAPRVRNAQFAAPGPTPGSTATTPPATTPTNLTPADNSSVPPGGSTTFTWSAVAGAGFYFFELTGRNLSFTNPGGSFPDVRNGYLGSGLGGLLPGSRTSLPVNVPANAPSASFQWRVIAISAESNPVGPFSNAFTINIGAAGTTAGAGPTPERGN